MKHLIGGWALGTIVAGTILAIKANNGTILFDCFLWAGMVVGPLAIRLFLRPMESQA